MAWRLYNDPNQSTANTPHYIEIADPSLSRTTGVDHGCTLSFWYRPIHFKWKYAYQSQQFVSYGNNGTQGNWGFHARMSYTELSIEWRQPGGTNFSSTTIGEWNQPGWKHLVIRISEGYGNQRATTFLNGHRIHTGTSEIWISGAGKPLRIGRAMDEDFSETAPGCFDIAEVSYWSDSLTDSECHILHKVQDPRVVRNANWELYFPLHESAPKVCYGSKANISSVTVSGGNPVPHPPVNSLFVTMQSRLAPQGVRMPRSFAGLGTRVGVRQPFTVSEIVIYG